jgi:hypothetical protein
VDRKNVGFGRSESGVEAVVYQQTPCVTEGDVANEIFDVDSPVSESTALLVRFGDLSLEGYDALEAGFEVGHVLSCLSSPVVYRLD